MSARVAGWVRARRGIVLLVVALAALTQLPLPFWGDQALFTYAAHGMRHGDRLYVDIWDYKQPGIFLWYEAAGALFGFHEAGIHLAELLWWVGLAAVTQRVMRDRVAHEWVGTIAPLFTAGAFFAAARAWDFGQIEDLVALPLLLSLWFAAAAGAQAPGSRPRATRLLLSGLMAAVVVGFKLVYGLIPIAFWLYLLIGWRRDEPRASRSLRRDAALLGTGLVVPLLPLLLYFVHEGLLGTMWWTYITYPPHVVRTISPPPFSRLRDGVSNFVRAFAWLVPFASVGLSTLRSRATRRRDPLVVGLVIWIVVGWFTVLVQNQWGYQFMLLVVPLGLLAAYGVDRLCREWRRGRAHNAISVLLVIAVALALMPARLAVHKVRLLASDDFTLGATGRHDFEAAFEPYYPDARAAAAWVDDPARTPGPIHVEGNPLIQYLSNRPFALREHGWAPEQSDARLWRWTRAGLRDDRPVYVFVDDFSRDIMRERSPQTLALIGRLYCKVQPIGDGAWYALRSGGECRARR